MARPYKSGVDYFPLDVSPDDKIKLLEAKHKLTGFSVWVKLLQKIYSNSYWLEWSEDIKILFSNEVNVDINEVNDIINSCLHWKIFNKCIFDSYSILTSTGIQKRYFEITWRRKQIEVIEQLMLIDVTPGPKQEFINVDINSVITVNSTQSKGKESKKKEIKKDNNIYAPLPEDFKISEKLIAWAKDHDISEKALKIHVEMCLNHFQDGKTKRPGWERTIMTWAMKDYDKINDKYPVQSEFSYL